MSGQIGIKVAKLTINGSEYSVPENDDMPLLWFIRETVKLRGTKYGCGQGQCGACTVHINGSASRSCLIPVSALDGAVIRTIEDLSNGNELHPVQRAWMELDVPQCGYCQAGQIMSTVDLLSRNASPTDSDIDQYMTNICRCGTYPRIRQAIHRAAEITTDSDQ
jgi:isoquinoline 1-oxidoreductase alpha subunit